MAMQLFYATNRNPVGSADAPKSYGTRLGKNSGQDLRFGRVSVSAESAHIERLLADDPATSATSGQALSEYFAQCANGGRIEPYPENFDKLQSEGQQRDIKLGSRAMFADLFEVMKAGTDVVVYVHGFNVSWADAVGSALALQVMLARAPRRDPAQSVVVVLFSWPSDGMALPFMSYLSDRADAHTSGLAVGRGFLKLRDFLLKLHSDARKDKIDLCQQSIHLLCHSMGNFVLQNALEQVWQNTPGSTLPRIFDQIFLCSPDTDDNVLEDQQPLSRLPQMTQFLTIYHNHHDKALMISDTSKGNPERLGANGVARLSLLHNKVHQVDCQNVAAGLTQHSYYLDPATVHDIRASIDAWAPEDGRRARQRRGAADNAWTLTHNP